MQLGHCGIDIVLPLASVHICLFAQSRLNHLIRYNQGSASGMAENERLTLNCLVVGTHNSNIFSIQMGLDGKVDELEYSIMANLHPGIVHLSHPSLILWKVPRVLDLLRRLLTSFWIGGCLPPSASVAGWIV
jgi:hypothetical protein